MSTKSLFANALQAQEAISGAMEKAIALLEDRGRIDPALTPMTSLEEKYDEIQEYRLQLSNVMAKILKEGKTPSSNNTIIKTPAKQKIYKAANAEKEVDGNGKHYWTDDY